jgi:hypothetical protein
MKDWVEALWSWRTASEGGPYMEIKAHDQA